MVTIVLVEKTGELKSCKYANDTGDELYKKCKFKKNDSFELRHSWKTKKQKYTFNTVSLYARDTGKANTENKYDFPPPVDSILYFGCCCLVAYDVDNNIVDLSVDMWEKFYEDLFGGFENLADTAKEDEEEEDELENIPAEMKTKTGYLKDGFVVDDNVIDGKTTSDGSVEEDEWDDTSSELELEFEEYSYSDEN
jgi:uncharacterized protein YkuJ